MVVDSRVGGATPLFPPRPAGERDEEGPFESRLRAQPTRQLVTVEAGEAEATAVVAVGLALRRVGDR